MRVLTRNSEGYRRIHILVDLGRRPHDCIACLHIAQPDEGSDGPAEDSHHNHHQEPATAERSLP